MYDIDRKTAARLLKVSTRTVDRYIVSKKISIERRDNRIWLDKKELLKLRAQRSVDTNVDMLMPVKSIDKSGIISVDMSIDDRLNGFQAQENVQKNYDESEYIRREHHTGGLQSENKAASSPEDRVYKKLFEELQLELKNSRERLEIANYRVGQLEANLKETVPLLEYNRNLEKLKLEQEQLHHNFDAQSTELEQARLILKDERLNKKVYLIILFILLLLQPLWFIFPMK